MYFISTAWLLRLLHWLMSTTSYLNLLLSASFFLPTSSKWVFIMFFFSWPVETCRSLFLHAECSEVHWAAQIRARCVDSGLQSESGSVSGCRDPAGLSPGKPQLSGVILPVADNNNNILPCRRKGWLLMYLWLYVPFLNLFSPLLDTCQVQGRFHLY